MQAPEEFVSERWSKTIIRSPTYMKFVTSIVCARDAEWQSVVHSLEMSNADAYALILGLESQIEKLKKALKK